MSKVLESMQNYLKPYYFSLSIVIVIIIFTIASYYSYIYFFKKEVEDSKFTDVANANNRNKTGDLYFFHVDWCPHCVKAKPEWNKFVPGDDESGEKMIKGYKINCRSIDCTNDDDLASKFKITSYPTIKLVLDGEDPIEFESKITKDTLETFVDTIIN